MQKISIIHTWNISTGYEKTDWPEKKRGFFFVNKCFIQVRMWFKKEKIIIWGYQRKNIVKSFTAIFVLALWVLKWNIFLPLYRQVWCYFLIRLFLDSELSLNYPTSSSSHSIVPMETHLSDLQNEKHKNR